MTKKTGRPPRRAAAARPTRAASTRARSTRAASKPRKQAVEAVPVTAEELRVLQRELERRLGGSSGSKRKGGATAHRAANSPPMRWNPDPEDVQKSVAQLVLTIVEFLRQLMERQAVRRMEANTLTADEVEAVGTALMTLEQTVKDIGQRFGLAPEDLNLDLGPIKLM